MRPFLTGVVRFAALTAAFAIAIGQHGFTEPEYTVIQMRDWGFGRPAGLMLASDGNFYGTTGDSHAAVFKMTPDRRLETIRQFAVDPRIGSPISPAPHVALIEGSDGFLYGTTSGGGAHGVQGGGTIFRVSKTGDLYETLYDLHSTFDGCGPGGLVEARDGKFYGMAECGPGGLGVVFRFDKTTRTFDRLATYRSDAEGIRVGVRGEVLTLGSDGTLYGPLSIGSAVASDGIRYATGGGILRVDPATGEVKTIVVFPDVQFGGPRTPNGGFVEMGDGSFYGTSKGGGAENLGTIFRFSGSGDNWTAARVYSFGGGRGARPESGPVMGADGWLYGTTRALEHLLFRFHVPTETFQPLHGFPSFQGDGFHPYARLVATSDAVYGTTFEGGTIGDGVIFRLDVASRQPTTIVADAANGTYGRPLAVSARLTGPSGPLAGQVIRFAVAGMEVGEATTDGNGVAWIHAEAAGGLNAGHHADAVVARFDGDDEYEPSTDTADADIARGTPLVLWAQPQPIVEGTPLGAAQFNASSDVLGSFIYSPPAGTVLPVGSGHVLSVAFTPADTVNYTSATATTTITVTRLPRLIAQTGVFTTRDNTPIFGLLPSTAPVNTSLDYAITSAPALGSAEVLDSVGRFRYTPRASVTGYDKFTFSVSDGDETSTGAVFVFIVAGNPTWPGTTTRATVASDGTQADAGNGYAAPSLSADGRVVAFYATSSNLVPGDSYGTADIFVHDRATQRTSLVSAAWSGGFGNGASYAPQISADGRVVAFWSMASNLVNDWNHIGDVFVRDLVTGLTMRVNVASDGTQANGDTAYPALSADGRVVAFTSRASNLVAGGTQGWQAFVHDRIAAQTSLVSVSSDGTAANAPAHVGALSADGRYVAFVSAASNLVAGDTNGEADVFVHDRLTRRTTRVNVASDGTQANAAGLDPVMSADGRIVVFSSAASNLLTAEGYGPRGLFAHDRATGQTTRLAISPAGFPAAPYADLLSISADGRFVTFWSTLSTLVEGDSNGVGDVFVHDRDTGATICVTSGLGGAQADNESHAPAISADGRVVSFYSAASNLVAGDTNGSWDVFVTQAAAPPTRVNNPPVVRNGVVTTSAGGSVHGSVDATDPDNDALTFAIAQQPAQGAVTVTDAASGRFVYTANATATGYDSFSFSVSDGATTVTGTQMIFVVAATPSWAGHTMRVSVATDGTEGNSPVDADWGHVSADGRFVVFTSLASTLVPVDTNGAYDVFIHDRQTRQTSRVSVSTSGAQANHHSHQPVLSADGRYVAFWSDASNLVAGDTNGSADVFLHDRQTGETSRVSLTSDGAQGNTTSYAPAISADARFVSFTSMASNLVAGDTNANWDVFVHDRQTGRTERVSVASDGIQGNNTSRFSAISADGRYVAFLSFASNLVAGDGNGVADVFVHDRQTAQTTRVSIATGGAQANGQSFGPAISADGRVVAFTSLASNLVAGDTNSAADAFVHDRVTGETRRVSVASDGAEAMGSSDQPSAHGPYNVSLTADGRIVTFTSLASNLAPGDTNSTWDVFAHDRQTAQTTRVSVASDGSQSAGISFYSSISADGRVIAFGSVAANLVANDTNGMADFFAVEAAPDSTPPVIVDIDGDGVADSEDNCPAQPNRVQSDVDGDGAGDVCDVCPADSSNRCSPGGSTAAEIPADIGGTLATPDGGLTLDIGAGDLSANATISVTQTIPQDPNVDVTIGSSAGLGKAIAVYDLQPDGLQFANPATLTISADVTSLNPRQRSRLNIYLFTDTDGDGAEESFVPIGATCQVVENPAGTFTAICRAEVSHFSTYALISPLDTDNDGVADRFGGEQDLCAGGPLTVTGLLPPLAGLVEDGVEPPSPRDAFRIGRTLPVKLRMSCSGTPLTDRDIAAPTVEGQAFRFGEGEWIYNLGTTGWAAGTHIIVIRTPEGRPLRAAFVLR